MPRRVIDLDEVEQALGRETREYLEDVAIELVNQLKIEAPVGATGDLQNSMQIFFRSENEIVVGSNLDYALDVQRGRGPHRPEFDKLQVWARRKLGDESAAGPVYRSIAKSGTDANPYVDRAIENTLDQFR